MESIKFNPITGTPDVQQISQKDKIKTELKADPENKNENAETQQQKPVDMDRLLEKANKMAKMSNKQIDFEIVDEGEPPVIVVTDKDTGKVIRKIPQEEMIRLSDRMQEFIGLIFNGRI